MILKFACSKIRFDALQKANINGADQTAGMHRLICAFVVCIQSKQVFLHQGPCNMHW